MATGGHIFLRSQFIFKTWPRIIPSQCNRCLSSAVTSNASIPATFLRQNGQLDVRIYQTRSMAKQKGFFSDMIENIKSDMQKNKDMKDNLKKFRDEAEKLEQSDALKKARQKFDTIQSETLGTGDEFKKKLGEFQDKIKETVDESGVAKKGGEIVGKVTESVGRTAETIAKQTEQLSQTKVFKSVSEGVEAVRDEAISRNKLYKSPVTLRRRDEYTISTNRKIIEADEESIGITLHKDSKFYESWQNFKDNNQFVNKMFDMKTKYDESDNMVIRATRSFTEKFTDLFGSMFSRTEMSDVLTEIVKMDPTFDSEQFVKECQIDLIPNILEAITRPNLEILEDWCHEAAFNTLAHPLKEAKKLGYRIENKVLDVSHVDLAAGEMMEQGPVLIISFTAQQLMCVRNAAGAIVEGDPEKIMKVFHVWAFCRDQTILDPKAAWRIIDLSSSPAEQWL